MKWYTCFFLFIQVFVQPMSACASDQGALNVLINSRACTLGAAAVALVGAGRYMVRRSPRVRSWFCRMRHAVASGSEYDARVAIAYHDGYFLSQCLQSSTIDLNGQTGLGEHTLLYHAVLCRFADGVRLLLEHGSNVNLGKKLFKETPLHKAAGIGHEAIVAQLLAGGASPAARDGLGYTPLYCAVRSGNVGAVRLLLDAGSNVHERDTFCGSTPLHEAAKQEAVFMVYYLLAQRARIDALTNIRKTALHVAIALGHEHVARALIEAGARIDVADNDGKTALHAAAQHGSMPMVQRLLAQGAEIDRFTRKRETALSIAIALRHEQVAQVLVSAGANTACVEGLLGCNLQRTMDQAVQERISAVQALAHSYQRPIPLDLARLIVQVGQTGMPCSRE